MVAMSETYCINCAKPANGGMIFYKNMGFVFCKKCWDFGYKIRQYQIDWPKKKKR